jgi:hypothetical protein
MISQVLGRGSHGGSEIRRGKKNLKPESVPAGAVWDDRGGYAAKMGRLRPPARSLRLGERANLHAVVAKADPYLGIFYSVVNLRFFT